MAEPDDLRRFLVPQRGPGAALADLVVGARRARHPMSPCSTPAERLPWAGHSARHAISEIYELIKEHNTTLIFVNTRSQAETHLPGTVAHQRR